MKKTFISAEETQKKGVMIPVRRSAIQTFVLVACFISACSVVDAFQPILSAGPLRSHVRSNPAGRSTPLLSTRLSSSSNSNMSNPSLSRPRRTTVAHALILVNLIVFLSDKVFRHPFARKSLYLSHWNWKWWQPLTACFCHVDRAHLSNNLFLLLLFGRSVEDDLGGGGLVVSYAVCGVFASLASLVLLPKHTTSIGASGAVFGLFAVSMLSKLSWREIFDWRKVVEVAVLGEFVFRQLASELTTAAGGGGRAGINHVAHLAGAAAGALMVFGMRVTVARFERAEKMDSKRRGPSV